jgi:para-nitrobenzyl esterase
MVRKTTTGFESAAGYTGRVPQRSWLVVLWAALMFLAGCSESSNPAATAADVEDEAMAVAPVAKSAEVSAPGPLAATVHGPVQGASEAGVLVFKGIPYGADTATTRFQAPQPPAAWSQPRSAVSFGDSCPQTSYPPGTAGGLFESWGNPLPLSEDCLRLNVWTPALRDGRKRPVMVWFHGGGFTRGSGSSLAYDGVRLVNRGDVVVVTVNHRLSMFGFLNLAQYGERYQDSGNTGMLDLVASLQWVRDNITEFGGDPDNVMIFGESGGGMKVSTLMAMSAAKGLFHKAVVQSGPMLNNRDAATAAEGAGQLLTSLGLDSDSVDEILEVTTEEIQRAAAAVVAAGNASGWTGPILDDRHIKRQPFTPDAPAQARAVPMLIGVNRTETSLFIGPRNPEAFEATWGTLPAMLQAAIPDVDAQSVIATYRRLNPDYDPADVLFGATTDRGFFQGSVTQADRKAMQGGANAYFYLFNWDTPVQGGKWRSPHSLEIGMVFDNVANSASMSGTGEDAHAMADIMADTWLAFARTGDPNNDQLPNWPAYNAGTRPMMMLDLSPQVIDDFHGEERALFE